ncbi:hypothetical protein [Reyranella soli]|uniref:Uncharacterized protein n=1 Tax=Reyranella soli TaxID=1230389 RepID=A0A512NCQ1_9HYPH|nr:hypothetical protein [Reyranella soli]GEP56727.1 hypothetical protein RSO01_38930 [Reyranella soli]
MAAETETSLSLETVDIPEAVALMAGAADDPATPVEPSASEALPTDDQIDRTEEDVPIAGPEAESSDGPPDFWSAEDRPLWAEVPERVRAVLGKYERQRAAHGHQKSQEAARARQEAAQAARAATGMVEQAAAWWHQNGPAFKKAFADKWAGIDWKALAEKDPAEVQRLIGQRQEEEALLAEADRRSKADIAAAQERAEQELMAARQGEHAKLAERLPEFFGPERARQTYDALSRFLFAKGIPANRIAAIYEAPIIELALSAMRFEKAQLALRSRDSGGGGRNPAKTTPTRIAPGPGSTPDNRTGEAIRQAGERFRQSGGTSIADAAELIRLSGL